MSIILSVLATGFADTITVPNDIINGYDKYDITTDRTYTIDGYMTVALSDDLNFLGMTVAGKTNLITRSCVIAAATVSGYTTYFNMNVKRASNNTTVEKLSYSGNGTSNADFDYMEKTKAYIYYILVNSKITSTSSSRTYIATPSITSQI